MGEINLSNSAGRDAIVNTESVSLFKQVRWLDSQHRQASGVRLVKSTTTHEIGALLSKYGDLNAVSSALVAADPEIDLENTGRFLTETSRVYVDKNRGIVRNVRFIEIIKNADGTVREERPRQLPETNISTETPLLWSGVYIPKAKAIRKFVFSGKSQLHHVNGLTFDFLHAMAKELEQRNSLMLLGAGPKSNQPLVLRRGATPYRGFLEGRTDGDRYCLLLHFSNLELKLPKLSDEAE
jgi:hypothetical protein